MVKRSDLGTGVSGINPQYEAKAASTAITENTLVTRDGSGRLVPATASSTTVLGPSMSRVVSTDTDYASNTFKVYDAAREGDLFEMDIVDTTSVVPGLAMTLKDAGTVDSYANIGAQKQVVINKVLPNNKVLVTLVTPTL